MKTLVFLLFFLFPGIMAGCQDYARGYVFEDSDGDGVMDRREKGIPGVAVSDGENIAVTDASGYYELKVRDHCVIFVIKPKGYMTPVDGNNLPQGYYIHKPDGSPASEHPGSQPTGDLPEKLDFPLLKYDDPEKFSFFAFGDSQPYSLEHLDYFHRGIVNDAKTRTEGISFGITLGDVVGDHLNLQPEYAKVMKEMGLPWYNVIGNHDRNLDSKDERFSNETFESNFGPSTFAFRYGDTHFIIIDNILRVSPEKASPYKGGFSEEQFTFLENYMKLVGEDDLIIVSYHIPIAYHEKQFIDKHRRRFFDILKGHKVLGLSAHTHIQMQFAIGSEYGWEGDGPYREYNVGTTNGDWYSGKIDPKTNLPDATMRDGTPPGYAIVDVDGNNYSFRYKVAGKDEDFQMSVYGPEVVGRGQKGFPIYANFFIGAPDDTVEFRIDGGGWKKMKRTENEVDPTFANKIYEWDRTTEKFMGRRPTSVPLYSTHLWKGALDPTLPPGEHRVEIRAVDMFGNEHYGEHTYTVIE